MTKKEHISFVLGIFLVTLFLTLSLLAPWLSPYRLGDGSLAEQFMPPSSTHWMGQNHLGEDLWTYLLFGLRQSLFISLATVVTSAFIGVGVGLLAGYMGGATDFCISRALDLFLAFPGILLALSLATFLGPSVWNVIFSLSAVSWVPFARLARIQTLSFRQRDFILSANALGISHLRVLLGHILPNLFSVLWVQVTFSLANAILAESGLSFLGVGVPIGTPSLGRAASDGARYLFQAWHLATFPGLLIMLSVLGLHFLGDTLKGRLNGTS